MNIGNQNFEIPPGASGKDKKQFRRESRKEKLVAAKDRTRKRENYGDIKISRRIPRDVSEAVRARDTGRDFGRPDHTCLRPGPPHHIIHFERYLRGEVTGDPHTMENLESPCKDCHDLAHAMSIPSGVSVASFFQSEFNNE